MIKNYLTIAFRKLFGNWIQSSINLSGLILGIASATLIFAYVSHEYQYDRFHTNSDRIFKAGGTLSFGGNEFNLFGFSPGFGQTLLESDERIEAISRLNQQQKIEISGNGKTFFENKFYFAEASFLNMFDFPILRGNPSDLDRPSHVFLTRDIAMKYFSTLDVIGKSITLGQETELIISGVMENPPSYSTFDFEFLGSAPTMGLMEEWKEQWENQKFQLGSFLTFLKLNQADSRELVEHTMAELNEDPSAKYQLIPIESLHLEFGDQAHNHQSNLSIFIAIGIMILLLAVINYINLTIAQATARYKEIGVRKINGASSTELTLQFFLESALFVTISFMAGSLLAYSLKDTIGQFLGIEIDNSFFTNPAFILIVLAMVMGLILLTGSYPALIMGRRISVNILKGSLGTGKKGSVWLQRGFSALQFSISVAMIFCTIVVWQQLSHLRSQELGIDKEQVMVVSVPGNASQPLASLKNELAAISGVDKVASSSLSMFSGGYSIFFVPIPERDDNGVSINYMTIDENFVELLGLEWLLEPVTSPKPGDLILNREAIAKLNLEENPVGEVLKIGGAGTISGVLENFVYSPLSSEISPTAMRIQKEETFAGENNFIYLKINRNSSVGNIIEQVKGKMNLFRSNSPVEYYFLDDAFNNLYRSQERLSYLLGIFSIIAVGVAVMGLLGLITFSLERRVKEIGIRKILGASPVQLVILLTSGYTWLFIASSLVAVPIAWIAMNNWLSQFTLQIEIKLVYALVPLLILIILGFLVVGFRSFIATKSNVIEALRSE